MSVTLELRLGEHTPAVAERLASWDETEVARRVWAKDHTVWFADDPPELTDRLGWLDVPTTLQERVPQFAEFGADIAAERFTDAVLLGMGGSSLAPEVYQATFGNAPHHPRLLVLDSTHPSAVLRVEREVDLASTLFIVSSKSGTTMETISLFRYFWSRVAADREAPGRQFVAVTDPGSSLEELAGRHAFRRVFLAPPDVGGRYSALTEFGLVPAAVIGVDLEALAAGALATSVACGPEGSALSNPGLQLGAALGELALEGHDKVTFVTNKALEALPSWIEQLVAESTGKDGRGIVPVGGEDPGPPASYGPDRFFVAIDTPDEPATSYLQTAVEGGHPVAHVRLESPADLGGAMFLFEMAVASAGAVLSIHPFDQPDVQLAKDLAERAMEGALESVDVAEILVDDPDLDEHVDSWLSSVTPRDYVALQAFVAPSADIAAVLHRARHTVRDRWRVATTLDFGPRLLHSTGQLHKGGPASGVFLQIVDRPRAGLAVPESSYSFDELIAAQSLGDVVALQQRGRRVLRVALGDDPLRGVEMLADAIGGAAG